MSYLPMISLENTDQYCKLRGCIQHLDEKIEELDFSAAIHYLEERYEKPYNEMLEKRGEVNKQIEITE